MRLYILLLLFLLFFIPARSYCQNNCEIVHVYIIPYGRESLVAPDATPDYLRVHAETKITISDVRIIDSLYSRITNIKKEKVSIMKRVDFTNCNIAIDFVKGNYIFYSIIINNCFQFIIDDGLLNRDVVVYEINNDFICYLKSLVPGFIEVLPDMIHCR